MHFEKAVRCFLLTFLIALLTGGDLVAAGPGGYVTLINGSPYDWKLVYNHSYQMDWNPVPIIPAGTSIEQYIEWWYVLSGDDKAEATYELVGSPVPASFQLQARQLGGNHIQVQFQDALSSLNNPQNSVINLGFAQDGGVAFILAGDGTQTYISSNPPVGWMQATLATIGSKSLREIAIPNSHDAGMSEITRGGYGGIYHNTATQSGTVYQQLTNGARWFDIRPVYRKGDWYTGHFTTGDFGTVGAMGRMIKDIVADINKFTFQNPGELIVLDVSHELDCASSWIWKLTPEQWQKLYQLLGGINDLWGMDPSSLPQDYSSFPISTFIQPGSKSTVLIRVPDHAPLPNVTTNGQSNTTSTPNLTLSAFMHESNLPFSGDYSDTDDPSYLATDQIDKLHSLRTFSQSPMQRSTWTITVGILDSLDFANWWHSIIGQATYAHRMLYAKLWPALSTSSYPNLIEVDDVKDSMVTALCMAINNNFASGGLNGMSEKVKATTADVVVRSAATPTATQDSSQNVAIPLSMLTPSVLRIKGRVVERKG